MSRAPSAAEVGDLGSGAHVPVVVALGSNLGDRTATLDGAVAAIAALDRVEVMAVSSWHDSVALTLDGPDAAAPAYLNGVLLARVTLSPLELLDALASIEDAAGRVRAERWGPRTLDLDIIVFGDHVSESARLTLPHPRAHERDFVLAPWLEIDPDAVLPGRGGVAGLLAALGAEVSQ